MKQIVIGLHGFGVTRSKEFIPLKLECIKNNIEFITFDMFDLTLKDLDYRLWIHKAESVVKKYIDDDYKVILIGFSMGGVIATFLATYLNIDRLILISPAFYYVNYDSTKNMIKKISEMDNNERQKYIFNKKPSLKYTNNFINIVNKLRKSIKLVTCPIYLVYGTNDELVPYKSIEYVKNNYKGNLIYNEFNNAYHELHFIGDYVEQVNNTIIMLIKN